MKGGGRPRQRRRARRLPEARVADSRARIYNFIAHLFHESPGPDTAATLSGEQFLDSVKDFLPVEGAKALKAEPPGDDGWFHELAVEHTGLFYAPTPQFVRPHEKDHRPPLPEGEGTWRGRVVGFYRECGLVPDGSAPESADFIGVELDFMGALCRKEAKAWKRGDSEGARAVLELEKRFLDDHLLAWAPSLCAEIGKKTTRGLFRGVASLLESFLGGDRERLTRC